MDALGTVVEVIESEPKIVLSVSRQGKCWLADYAERQGLDAEAIRKLLLKAQEWAMKWEAVRIASVAIEQAAGVTDWESIRRA